MRPVARILLSVSMIALVLALAGCIELDGESAPSWLPVPESAEETSVSQPDTATDDGYPMPGDAHGHGTEVLMLGRSEMAGWFDFWGWEPPGPFPQEGYVFYYREIVPPPDIGTDAARLVGQVPDGTVVVFMLSYADFDANSAAEAQSVADRNSGYVRQVIDALGERDLTLVLGTALPKVSAYTSPSLVQAHARYNTAVETIAAADDRVRVLDVYDALATNGVLARGLALSPDDSHLNSVAYGVLDQELLALLDTLP